MKIITLDTETYNGLIGKLKKIAIYDGIKVYYGNTFEEVEPVLLNYAKIGYSVHVYIHNAEFDLRKIPEIFDKSRIDWTQSVIINGKIAKIKCKDYTIHDSFKLLPMSLKTLSGKKGFNVKHGKLDLWAECQKRYPGKYKNLVDFLDRCEIDDSLFIEYLGYDVISLYEVLLKLITISGLSLNKFVTRLTTASLSRFIFKNGYKHNGEVIEFKDTKNLTSDYEIMTSFNWNNEPDIEDFLRKTYCGGRTEVFKTSLNGRKLKYGHGFHYDVNSLYPYVMQKEYPVGKPIYKENGEYAKYYFEDWMENHKGLGFINATINIPKQHIPPLPVKMGKLTFPTGKVYGSWTYHELEYAIKECGVEIVEYHAVCHFNRTFPVFKRFINTFYTLKEEGTNTGNYALRTLGKLLMNVGYGYTGMRRDDKTSLVSIDEIDEYNDVIFANPELGFIEVPTNVKAEYIQVQVASYVTSYARLVLLEAMRDVVKRGGNVYYCDTDSVVCDIPFDESIVDNAKIGFWDLEGKPIQGLFLRPKVYVEKFAKGEENIKFKGVSKETQQELSFDYYKGMYADMIVKNKDFRIVEKNRLTLRSIMYMTKNEIDFDYYENRDKKINYNTVEKRVMHYKENYTEPWHFETIEDFEHFNFNKIEPTVTFDMD